MHICNKTCKTIPTTTFHSREKPENTGSGTHIPGRPRNLRPDLWSATPYRGPGWQGGRGASPGAAGSPGAGGQRREVLSGPRGRRPCATYPRTPPSSPRERREHRSAQARGPATALWGRVGAGAAASRVPPRPVSASGYWRPKAPQRLDTPRCVSLIHEQGYLIL